jgi:hypothetical protein
VRLLGKALHAENRNPEHPTYRADGCGVAAEFVRETEDDCRIVNEDRPCVRMSPHDRVHIWDQRRVLAASEKIKAPSALNGIDLLSFCKVPGHGAERTCRASPGRVLTRSSIEPAAPSAALSTLSLLLPMFIEPAQNVQDLCNMVARPSLNAVRLVRDTDENTFHAQEFERLVVLLRIGHRCAKVGFTG